MVKHSLLEKKWSNVLCSSTREREIFKKTEKKKKLVLDCVFKTCFGQMFCLTEEEVAYYLFHYTFNALFTFYTLL